MRPAPVRLRPDNFTPATRTPWGGRKILDRFKAGLELEVDRAAHGVVGESWEVSVEPDFPSRTSTGLLLADVLAADPQAWLGAEAYSRFGPSTPLLVKLLDAADELSVQVHPSDQYTGLEPGQCGKPEAWYIVEREPGAGLYLGLREGVSREELSQALLSGSDLRPTLNFVSVEPADFFSIGPGVAHAIGRGVTLVEPQIVRPGKRGVTFRFWDWNRRYDSQGRLDPKGTPRALHVDHALAVTAFEGIRGDAFVDSVRVRPALRQTGDVQIARFAAGSIVAERISGSGTYAFGTDDRLWAVTVLHGEVSLGHESTAVRLPRGCSGVIPAASDGLFLALREADAILSSVI